MSEFLVTICLISVLWCAVMAYRTSSVIRQRRRFGLIESVHRTARLRSPRFSAITDRACDLVEATCHARGLDSNLATRAASLRDIGLASVPYRLLNSVPFAEWTDEDRARLREHLCVTDDLLAHVAAFEQERNVLRRSEAMFWLRDGEERPSADALILKACFDFAMNEAFFGTERAEALLIAGNGRDYDPKMAESLLQVLNARNSQLTRAFA